MSWTAGPAHQNFTARVVDGDRAGSVWGQALVGGVGIVLAVVLVMGQVTLATTHGIQKNLHQSVVQLQSGNKTMESVIEKAEPSILMDTVIAKQAQTLGHTQATMDKLNAEMLRTGATTQGLQKTVGTMEVTSQQLADIVGGMSGDTARMVTLLGRMPAATERTHKQLGRIGGDTADINIELAAISGKLTRYGLPQARNVQKR